MILQLTSCLAMMAVVSGIGRGSPFVSRFFLTCSRGFSRLALSSWSNNSRGGALAVTMTRGKSSIAGVWLAQAHPFSPEMFVIRVGVVYLLARSGS